MRFLIGQLAELAHLNPGVHPVPGSPSIVLVVVELQGPNRQVAAERADLRRFRVISRYCPHKRMDLEVEGRLRAREGLVNSTTQEMELACYHARFRWCLATGESSNPRAGSLLLYRLEVDHDSGHLYAHPVDGEHAGPAVA